MSALPPAGARDPLVDFAALDPLDMMNPEHVLPAVSRLLSARYSEGLNAYRVSMGLKPWPKRRSSKRTKLLPGLGDETLMDEG